MTPTHQPRLKPAEQSLLRNPVDVAAFLTFWLIPLYLLSARLEVPGMGAIGQPATLLALGAGVWWLVARAVTELGLDQRSNPVRVALFVYAFYMVVSFGVGGMRSLTELEQSASLRALIDVAALVSIALIASDGIASLDRLSRLLRRMTTIGVLFALYGILQSITGEDHLLSPPGLVWNSGVIPGVGTRGGFVRPFGTGLHPIEYGVVVASLLPLAIHFFLHPESTRDRGQAIAETAVLVYAMLVSLSRSAIVSAGGAVVVLGLGWSWRRRFNAFIVMLFGVPIVGTIVPGLFGQMVELLTGLEDHASVQARIERVPRILALIRERPWFGWGHGTYTVDDYFLIDNQLWVTTITSGIVGLVVVMSLPMVAAGAVVWFSGRLERSNPAVRSMGWAIAASIAGLMLSTVVFTAFSYRILTFTLFLLLGCAGAFFRLAKELLQAE